MELPADIILEDLPNDYVLCSAKESRNLLIKKKQSKLLLLDLTDSDARSLIESIKPHIVFNSEYHKKGDHGHQVNSGIDLPTFKFMKEKGLVYGIDCAKLYSHIQRGKQLYLLPRFSQNIMLAKKAGVSIFLFSGTGKLSVEKRKALLQILRHTQKSA